MSRWDALRYSLQALAQDSLFQRQLLTAWRDNVAELPERFVHAEKHLIDGEKIEFTPLQRQALAALHAQFESMCGPSNADHWSDIALDSSPEWSAIRVAATRCLDAFAWPLQRPPLAREVYGEDFCVQNSA